MNLRNAFYVIVSLALICVVTLAGCSESDAKKKASNKPTQPTLSTYSELPTNSYPKKPSNALDYHQHEEAFFRIGVDHFLTKNDLQVSEGDKKEIAEFMVSALEGAGKRYDVAQWQQVVKNGGKLLVRLKDQLTDEPMFNFCLALGESQINRPEAAAQRLDYAVHQFASNDYPARIVVGAMRVLGDMRSEYRIRSLFPQRAEAVKYWLTHDFRARGIDERIAYTELEKFFAYAFRKKHEAPQAVVAEVIRESETLPSWLRSMALGAYEYELGYFHRGYGYANTVTDEGWRKLEEHSKIAEQHFKDALEINPMFPEAAVGLMQISQLGYSDQDEDYWFNKAIEHEYDFMPAYNTRLYTLSPRWGGSAKQMLDFALEHARKKQYESCVPFILPTCLFRLRGYGDLSKKEYDELLAEGEIADETVKALEGMLEHNNQYVFDGSLYDKSYLQTLLALYLIKADRIDEAERVFKELDGHYSSAAIYFFGEGAAGSLESLMAKASAFSAEYGEDARKIQAMMLVPFEQRIQNMEAIEELVASTSPSDESGGLYFKRALEQVRNERNFSEGKWVNLKVDSPMNMWAMLNNRLLTYVSDSTVSFNNALGGMYNTAVYRSSFPGPKVFEATLKFPSGKTPDVDFAPGIQLGRSEKFYYTIGFAMTDEPAISSSASGVHESVKIGQVRFGESRTASNRKPYVIAFPYEDNEFSVRVMYDRKQIEVYIDDSFLFRNKAEELLQSADGIVFHTNQGIVGTGEVEFVDAKVKKWNPPPESTDSKILLEHYQKLVEADPKDKWNQFWLANAKHADGDLDGAMELYEKSRLAGISDEFVDFYIGDILDRQGKHEEAFQHYLRSATGFRSDGKFEQRCMPLFTSWSSTPANWSCFRIDWLAKSRGFEIDKEISEKFVAENCALPRLLWLVSVGKKIPSRNPANRSKVDSIVREINVMLKIAPEEYRSIVSTISAAVSNDKVYDESKIGRSLYLDVEGATPFFPISYGMRPMP